MNHHRASSNAMRTSAQLRQRAADVEVGAIANKALVAKSAVGQLRADSDATCAARVGGAGTVAVERALHVDRVAARRWADGPVKLDAFVVNEGVRGMPRPGLLEREV